MEELSRQTIALAVLLAFIVYCGVGSWIAALILRLSMKLVIKKTVLWGQSFVTAFLIMLSQFVLALIFIGIMLAADFSRQEIREHPLQYILWPIQFVIQAWITQITMKLSFNQACSITAVTIGIGMAIGIAIAILVVIVGLMIFGLGGLKRF